MMAEEEQSGLDLGDSLDDAVTSEGSSGDGSSSSGGSNGGRRSPVIVKGRYGTEFYDAGTGCRDCNRRAIGVLVSKKSLGNKDTKKGVPLCTSCKKDIAEDLGVEADELVFKRFVD